ncbi:MAG TPA: hypothetical protein VEJ18_14675, partial [Planctomycetota bacterium]|nr:hypothetical protein [Planctomycetota bacterium]
TGCGGDVTAGKYNDGTPEAKHRLSTRLYSGLVRAIGDTKRAPAGPIDWKVVDVRLPLHPSFKAGAFRTTLEDPASPPQKRIQAAMSLAWIERLEKRPSIDTNRLRLGPVDLVHLPGEAFVAFQLHAQAARPDRFVCVASYGEGGPGYICTDAAHAEGGYEPTAAYVGPPSEPILKDAIDRLLR